MSVKHGRRSGFSIRRILFLPAGKSRRLVVVGRRRVVQNGLIAGLCLNLSLDLAEVLLHLPQVVVRSLFGTEDMAEEMTGVIVQVMTYIMMEVMT